MTHSIDFYFDFSSPYGYFAAHRIASITQKHDASVAWRPILLGSIFKITGAGPLTQAPIKNDYARRDFARTARLYGIPFALPGVFPFSGASACRIFYGVHKSDPDLAIAYAQAVFEAAFAKDKDPGVPAVAQAVGEAVGLAADVLHGYLDDPVLKQEVRAVTDEALARGVFGSPFFFVDGEPFWGHDRLGEIDAWLTGGGW